MMKKGKLLALLLGASLALVACGDKEEAATVTDPQKIYNQSCLQCHGKELQGQGMAPALNAVGSKYSKEEIETIINEGKGGMPPGLIKDEEQVLLLAEWLAEKK